MTMRASEVEDASGTDGVDLEAMRVEVVRRLEQVRKIGRDPRRVALAMEVARRDVVGWIEDWVVTFDPNCHEMPELPLMLFPRQVELLRWIEMLLERKAEGVLEKSREIGASWVVAMFALHRWLFAPGFLTTFGSYKAEKVDHRGDSGSIFEKLRIALDGLPGWMLPEGYKPGEHDNFMRLINPENGNQILGEVGANMGRGGRSTLFAVDEGAFVEEARSADRAISRNADARLWISTPSPQGMNTVFYEKRQRTLARDPGLVFRFHYSDDPRRGTAWVTAKRSELGEEAWAAEQEIDYSGATERPLIRAAWVEASKELARRVKASRRRVPERLKAAIDHLAVEKAGMPVEIFDQDWSGDGPEMRAALLAEGLATELDGAIRLLSERERALETSGSREAGLDVGAGKNESVMVVREGPLLLDLGARSDPDGVDTASWGVARARQMGVTVLRYDSAGVGITQGAIMSRMEKGIRLEAINVGEKVPSHLSVTEGKNVVPARQRFVNLKAWGWWGLRERAHASWEVVTGAGEHPLDECLLIGIDDLQLETQLCQPTWTTTLQGKKQVDKAPKGSKSPDRAEAAMLAYMDVAAHISLVW